MARVIISSGHTSQDPGAVFEDLKEVDLTRKIASKVLEGLRKKNIVCLSPPLDLNLAQRIEWINNTGYNEAQGDICIEIHINDGGKSGLEGWFKGPGNNPSQQLTARIIEIASKRTGLTNQGVKNEFDHPLKSLAFLNRTNPISSLVETLYIDNPDDIQFLKDDSKLDNLAEAITEGIEQFIIGQERKEESSTPHHNTKTVNSNIITQQQPQSQQTPQPSINLPLATSTIQTPSKPTTPAVSMSPQANLSQTMPQSSALGQDREQRKKMINERYQMILGRLPNQNDLNYFLNIGINEEQLIQRMIESQEHVDLVKAGREADSLKDKLDMQESELLKLRASDKDKDQIIENLNSLINQKNETIASATKGRSRPSNIGDGKSKNKSDIIYRPSLSEKILGFFNKVFG